MTNSPQFIQATEAVKKLKYTPDNTTLGKFYGLYKQATLGDNDTPKPSFINMKDSVKWNNWTNCKGMSTYEAEVAYITLVNELLRK